MRLTITANKYLQMKMNGLEGEYCDSLGNITASTKRSSSFILWFILFCLLFYFALSFKFCLVLWGKLQEQRADPGNDKMSGNRMHNVNSTKSQYKL